MKFDDLDWNDSATLLVAKAKVLMDTVRATPDGMYGPPYDIEWWKNFSADISALMVRVNQTFPFTTSEREKFKSMLDPSPAQDTVQ